MFKCLPPSLHLISCLLVYTKIFHNASTPCDIKTINSNSVNSPLSAFKCLLISRARINVKNHTVCLSSLKMCCVLTRACLLLVYSEIIAKYQLSSTKMLSNCNRAHFSKSNYFQTIDFDSNDISFMQILIFPVLSLADALLLLLLWAI